MSKNLKKNILIEKELFSSPVGVFFQENGCELFSEYSSDKDYIFAVDSVCPEVLNLPRLVTDKSKELSVKLSPLVRAYINAANFSYPLAKKVLADYFNETHAFDLVERYSSDFKNIYTLKIHDYLNVGFFIDTIVVDAYKAGFDINSLREYLNKALSYAVKKIEKSRNHAPVDLAYSHNGQSLAMRMIFQSEHFEGPQEISMHDFSKGVNFFDVTFFGKKKQIIFSSLMFKDEAMKNVQASFFTEVASRTLIPQNASSSSLDLALKVQEHIIYEPEKIETETLAQSHRKVQEISRSNIDEQLNDFQRVFSQKTLADVEDIFIVRGAQQDSNNDVLKIKSWIGDRPDISDNEKWEIKRTEIKNKIEAEAEKIFSEGRSVVVEDLINVIANELKADIQDAKKIFNVIIEDVVTNDLFLNEVSNPEIDNERDQLEAQIKRMKKIILHLKYELLKSGPTNIAEKTLPPSETDDTVRLRAALVKSINFIKAKDRSVERMKEEFEISSRNKDYKIDALEIQIENMQAERLKQHGFSNEERAAVAEAENRNLLARLEISNKKIENISNNFDHHENEVIAKKDQEIDFLKSSITSLQVSYAKLQEEHQGPIPVATKEDLLDRDRIIQSLSAEKKLFDERLRAQGVELKKAEQRLKFATSQVEILSKKKDNSTKGSEAHAKQIEQLTTRAAEVAHDLSEKKKEIHKLKQENFVMSAKMGELEKKLSYLDKKAS